MGRRGLEQLAHASDSDQSDHPAERAPGGHVRPGAEVSGTNPPILRRALHLRRQFRALPT